ncbi:GNAT family N-acetyltransferase [Pseudalkalibacillus berkeleyi]|uniref:GNAT family N-acetyltransferase n=1 Tax=Pseudalkalibacillus berkeleyi TaxID=1069813 RepID=A0ABS9H5Q0_9BACL|nr:GNAT family N-acetyltransferase [Pseudalkalibacillus berkeleyi]MCF6139274.1 GNAT family N-acetyltransferase [Pseudalkalibacillus berkeleyi]
MIEIRKLGPDEAEAYYKLRLEGLEKFPEAFASSYEEEVTRTINDVKHNMEKEDRFTAGAYYGNELVGIGTFFQHTKKKLKHKGEIVGVYVSQHVQRNGIGFKLLQYLVDEASSIEGIEQILLTVMSENRSAIRSYEKLGFQSYGVEEHSLKIEGYYYDEILMKLNLSKKDETSS